MSKMESSSKTRKSTGTIAFVLAFSVVALAASGAAYGARTKPAPDITDKVCQGIGGTWKSNTCTIPEGSNGVAISDFKITKPKTLDVKGSLTINAGVTIVNDGMIVVENVAGVTPAKFFATEWMAGILVFGTLDNSGTITIRNASAKTWGIVVSVSDSSNDPSAPNPMLVVPGVLTNSGMISIQNEGESQGINNLGALNNAASGTITVANSLPSPDNSAGIRNGRVAVPPYYGYVLGGIAGTIVNAGTITVANGGNADGRGISNAGSFTNTATGTFTINPSPAPAPDDAALGLRNNGTFTNFGTFTNNRGRIDGPTWGVENLSPGAMVNYGRTYVGTPSDGAGTFLNHKIMINLGEITSYGILADVSADVTMINYGTIYNYGGIGGGQNVGICVEEPGSLGGC